MTSFFPRNNLSIDIRRARVLAPVHERQFFKDDQTKALTRSMEGMPTYTSAEVSKHASAHDAWVIINGKVLDITTWLEEHPGGEDVLLAAAGTYLPPSLLFITICVVASPSAIIRIVQLTSTSNCAAHNAEIN